MAQSCDVCGKSIIFGNQKQQRGKAKYLGGNGRKTTGISRRIFRPNLQRIKVQDGPSVATKRVCTTCIRANRVTKAVVRKPFTIPAAN
jgi:large subunit ribosomal protein L28